MPSTFRSTGASAQTWQVDVNVDGVSLGTFDAFSGGDASADVQKHRPGGMKPQKAYPSMSEYADVTVKRAWEVDRDGDLYAWLHTRVGLGDMTASMILLNRDGTVSTAKNGRWTFSGILSGITTPEVDSDGNDVSMFELTMVVGGRS